MSRTLDASLVSSSNLLICILCIVNLWLFAQRFAATDLNSQPIVEPLPGVVPAVGRARIQPLAPPACGGITTVRAQLDQYQVLVGNGSVGRAKAVGCDVVLWPDALKGLSMEVGFMGRPG